MSSMQGLYTYGIAGGAPQQPVLGFGGHGRGVRGGPLKMRGGGEPPLLMVSVSNEKGKI